MKPAPISLVLLNPITRLNPGAIFIKSTWGGILKKDALLGVNLIKAARAGGIDGKEMRTSRGLLMEWKDARPGVLMEWKDARPWGVD